MRNPVSSRRDGHGDNASSRPQPTSAGRRRLPADDIARPPNGGAGTSRWPRTNIARYTKRIVDRLAVDDKDAVFWDRELPGFGLRVYPSGAKVYVVQTRCAARSKRVTVGRHGDVSPDQARKEAVRIIARIKSGEEPIPVAPKADPTMADLAERYQREHVAMRCRPATVAHYGIMLAKHIVPALGELKVAEVERRHILSFHYALREKPTVANRALDNAHQDVQLGRGVGGCTRGRKSMPVREEVQGAKLRAVPLRRGVPPAWTCARRSPGRGKDLGERRCRDTSADAHRLPARRNHEASLGGRGPGGRRATVA